jgi:magnesium transporter
MTLLNENNMWKFGLALNIGGSVMVNFGTNLMKSAHNIAIENDQRRMKDETIFTSKNVWTFGMSIFVFGSIVNFASFAFAAQSLLAALGTVQFISNVFFAKFVLNETLTPRIFFATGVIMGGLVLAILCSNHENDLYTTEDLLNLYTPGYMLFLIFVGILLVVCHFTYTVYTHYESAGAPLPMNGIMRPTCYSIVSATVGTQSVLQSKCLAELIKATINGDNQFDKPFVYIIIAVFACGLSFWLYRMNAALKKFDGLVIIPLLQVFWTTSAIFQGGVYFQEFMKFTPLQTTGFLSGVGIVFVGVFLLNPTHDREILLPDSDSTHSSAGDLMDSSASSSTHQGARFTSNHGQSQSYSMSSLSVRGLHGIYDDGGSDVPHMIGFTTLPVLVEPVPRLSHRRSTEHSHNSSVELNSKKDSNILPSTSVDIKLRQSGSCDVESLPFSSSSQSPTDEGGSVQKNPLSRYKNQIVV